MPSDARATRALEALAEPRDAFRAARGGGARRRCASYLAAHRGATRDRAQRRRSELGRVRRRPHRRRSASARCCADARALDAGGGGALGDVRRRARRAAGARRRAVRASTCRRGGDSARRRWTRALADGGPRVRRGARVPGACARGAYHAPSARRRCCATFPFARWNRARARRSRRRSWSRSTARTCAPSMLVEYPRRRRCGSCSWCDGAASPAPLVRLITPGVLVLQTSDARRSTRSRRRDGPAIAALRARRMRASFCTIRAAARALDERLTIDAVPATSRRARRSAGARRAGSCDELRAARGAGRAVPRGARRVGGGGAAARRRSARNGEAQRGRGGRRGC